jgi:serine phosphatase RsbU (regulator of sigma subunit)
LVASAILLGLALALGLAQGMAIARPLDRLRAGMGEIGRGQLGARIDGPAAALTPLCTSFNDMAERLVGMVRETTERALADKDQEVARAIQDTLVPSADPIDRRFVRLAGYFQPAAQCGGDWWSVHDLQDDKLLVLIGDVTGHGVPSALVTAAAKAACDTVRAMTQDNVTVTYLLEILNRAIYQAAKRRFVMTCCACILDPRTRTITYANAGHHFPYLYRQSGGRGQFGCLMTRGNRLGDVADSKYVAKQMELLSGDVLVWYTDGMVECENDRGEQYGEKRFRTAIRRAAHLEPAEMRGAVVAAVSQFFGEKPRKDDMTLVVARVYA